MSVTCEYNWYTCCFFQFNSVCVNQCQRGWRDWKRPIVTKNTHAPMKIMMTILKVLASRSKIYPTPRSAVTKSTTLYEDILKLLVVRFIKWLALLESQGVWEHYWPHRENPHWARYPVPALQHTCAQLRNGLCIFFVLVLQWQERQQQNVARIANAVQCHN